METDDRPGSAEHPQRVLDMKALGATFADSPFAWLAAAAAADLGSRERTDRAPRKRPSSVPDLPNDRIKTMRAKVVPVTGLSRQQPRTYETQP